VHIIPVLDLLGGTVVRGVAGNRGEYRPLVSRLVKSSHPLAVASALRAQFGWNRFYVADLDAILHGRPNLQTLAELRQKGFELWVDAGFADIESLAPLAAAGVDTFILGLETWQGPGELARVCRAQPAEQLLFSLDLRGGVPLAACSDWDLSSPIALVRQLEDCGIRRLILLDLADVGVGAGTSTLDLARQVRQRFPGLELITGGGVRHVADLVQLRELGIRGALVASALHDERITAADLHQHGF
jgi:phosphoribosylformimino-5-aminoimidazole carboxamide ribotide isomerase